MGSPSPDETGRIARRLAASALAFVFLTLTASVASASPKEAQARFEEGRALVKAGHPDEAIPKFLASIAAEPTVAALLNLADCYERVGKLASARARFKQADDLARGEDPVRYDEARKRVELLDPRVSTITLIPPPKNEPAQVWIDAVEVPKERWGSPLPYDGGEHEVITQDAAGARKTTNVVLPVEGARETVAVSDAPAPGGARDGAARASASGASGAGEAPGSQAARGDASGGPRSSSTMRTVGLAIGATGIVALGVGAVSGFVALGAKGDLNDACPAYPRCPAERRDELVDVDDRARTFGTVSTITLVVGGALTALGAVLFLTSPSPSSSSAVGSSAPPAAPAPRFFAGPGFAGGTW
jgi:hypothetical protein